MKAALVVHVTFGVLAFGWEQPAVQLSALEERDLGISVPPDAFLHDLADTYLTDVVVSVRFTAATGGEYDDRILHGSFVAWPNGPSGEPVLWSTEEADLFAPHGVLDPELQQLAASVAPGARLVPPVFGRMRDMAPEIDLTEENDPLPEPDDNSDEKDLG